MEKILNNFRNSLNGIKAAWRDDNSFRISLLQVIAGVIIATLLTFYLNKNAYFWLTLVVSLFPIIIVEAINTSIEAITDKASPERHPLAKKAKDIGSAAVLFTRLMTVICWVVAIGREMARAAS